MPSSTPRYTGRERKTIGERVGRIVKDWVDANNSSVEELAKRMDYKSGSSVSKVISGQDPPSRQLLAQLQRVTGVDISCVLENL